MVGRRRGRRKRRSCGRSAGRGGASLPEYVELTVERIAEQLEPESGGSQEREVRAHDPPCLESRQRPPAAHRTFDCVIGERGGADRPQDRQQRRPACELALALHRHKDGPVPQVDRVGEAADVRDRCPSHQGVEGCGAPCQSPLRRVWSGAELRRDFGEGVGLLGQHQGALGGASKYEAERTADR